MITGWLEALFPPDDPETDGGYDPAQCPSCGGPGTPTNGQTWECHSRGCHLETYNPMTGERVFAW